MLAEYEHMSQYIYTRKSVPIGEKIRLEVQFADSAGNPKDTDSLPTLEVTDAATASVLASTASGIARIGMGRYRYELDIPTGFVSGLWNDGWLGAVDGYTLSATFDFLVNSIGTISAVGNIVEPEPQIGDEPELLFSREEIKGINMLLKILKSRILNIRYDQNGNLCPVFGNDDLVGYLCASLAEFNATPAITGYSFDNQLIPTIWADVITQGAYLIGMVAKSVHEAGREFVLNDNGVTVNPPPVSSTIMSAYNAQLTDYRAKLKEIKRNHRSRPFGVGAGSILVVNPITRRYRHRRENIII